MSKRRLAKKVGLDFEEVKNILSSETLQQFELSSIIGGKELFPACLCQPECNCAPQDNTCKGTPTG